MGIHKISILRWAALFLTVGLALTVTLPASAIAPGLQEYFILGYEEHIYRMYASTGTVDANDPNERYMASIVDITVTADGQQVYYDHWEDGYEADILNPQQATTVIFGDGDPANGHAGVYTGRAEDTLLAGDSLSLSSRYELLNPEDVSNYVPVDPRDPADIRFDGGDRIVSTGGPVALVHNMWPADLSLTLPDRTIMGDAWEIYSTQALENGYSYRSPIGEDLAADQFDNVDLQVQALEDNTTVSVGNGVLTATFVLDRGQTYLSMGYIDTDAFTETLAVNVTVGTAIQSDKPVQAGVIAYRTGFQDRYYNMIPDIIWGREYMMPVPYNGRVAEVYIYNPNPYAITVTFADRSKNGTFSVPAMSTVDYTARAGSSVPTLSSVYLSSDTPFWAIAAADSNSTSFDWGFTFIPQVFLTDEYYASWAPGNVLEPPRQSVCNAYGNMGGATLCCNGSPLWISAVEDGTMVNVDYDNDDVIDSTFTLNMFDVRLIRDNSDFDQSGTHIWTEGGQKIAVIWGEDPAVAGDQAPNLDVGHLVLPLYQGWLTPPIMLEKTASPEILPASGGTVTFKLTTTAAFFADLDNIVITDTLPYSWNYVNDSAVVTYSDGTSVHFEPAITTEAGQQTLYWNLATSLGPEQPLIVEFDATLAAVGGIEAQHFDGFESYNYSGGSGPWLTDWTEENETDGPTAGSIRIYGTDFWVTPNVVPAKGTRQLRIQGKNSANNDISRRVELNSFVQPILRFDRYLRGMDNNDVFGVELSTDGMNYTRVFTWTNAAQQNFWFAEELDLTPYRASDVRLRFGSFNNTTDSGAYNYLDNIEIYDRLAVNTNHAQARAIYRDHEYAVVARKTVYLSPFRLSQTASASQVALGDTLVFTLTYENMSGAVAGTNVILQNSLSPGLNFVSASGGGQYSPGINTIKWDIGDLPPSTSASVTFTATINATVPPNDGDVIENTARLSSNQTTVRSNTVAVTVWAPRIVNVIKSAPGSAAPGDTITYTLSYANTGALTATHMLITDTLNAYLTYVPESCSDNCPSLSDGVVLQWDLVEIAPNATGLLSFAVQISAATPAGTLLQNTAYYVHDALSDPRPTNTAATLISLVTLNKSADTSRVGPDQTITFSLDYANAGGITQTHVLITDPIPAFTTYVAGSATSVADVLTPTYSIDGGTTYQTTEPVNPATVTHLRWELVELTPGMNGTTSFQTRVAAADSLPNATDIRNQASLTSAQGTRVFSNQVVIPTVKLTLDKLGPGIVAPGETFTYTLRFGNPGSGAATALLSDTLPANVNLISASPAPATTTPLNWTVTIPANTNNLDYTVVVSVPADIPIGTELRNAATLSSAQHTVEAMLLTYIASPDVSLIPNNTAAADQLQTLCYAHTVFNNSAYSDTVNLAATHSLWANPVLMLYRDVNANGKYEVSTDVALADTNDDSILDTGLLLEQGLVRILACVTVPADVADGSSNVTTLRATSTRIPDRFSEATDTTTIPVGAGLTLTKSQIDVDGAPLYPGDSLTYTLVLANVDVVPHTAVILTDTAPAGVSFSGGELQPGGDLTVTATSVTATIASLAPGARVTVTLAAQLAPTMPVGPLTNTAYADSTQQAAPVSAISSGTVEGLALAKTAEDENGAPLYVGDIVRYVITVTNASTQTTQTGIVVTDTLPAGVAFVAADPAPDGSDPLVWNVGTLLSGATWTTTVRVQVDGSANPIGANVAEVSSDQQTTQETVPVLPPDDGGGESGDIDPGLTLAKTAEDENGAPLYVGDIVRYTISVTNASTQTMQTGVVVTDSLPAGVTFVEATPAPNGQNPLVWNVGTLAPGATWTAAVRVQVDGSVNPIGANVAEVRSSQQTTQETDPVLPPGDGGGGSGDVDPGLDLAKIATDENGSPLLVGDIVRYVISVTNASTQTTQTGVIVTDTLPAGVAFVEATPTPDGQNPLVWNVGTLPPGATWTTIVRVQVDGSANPIGANVAEVSSDQQNEQETDPVLPPDDGGGGSGNVDPGLALAKTAEDENGAPLYVGDIVHYVISVTNASTQTAQTGVVVTDSLPAGVTFVEATPAPDGQNPLVWNVGTLAPGSTWTATVRVQVDGSANPIGANVAEVSSDQQTTQETVPVLLPDDGGGESGDVDPGLALAKTVEDENGAPLYIDDIVRYVITVTNASAQNTQTGVVVTDTLPAGVTFVSADPDPDGSDPLVWNVGTFAPGGIWTATVRVQVDGLANPIGANIAEVSSDQQSAQETDPVLPPAPVLRYVLVVQTVGQGSVTIDPEQTSYAYGDVVTLTATADPGWTFSAWSGDATGTDAEITVTITADTGVTATFTQDEYTLAVNTVGSGNVTRDPDQTTYHYNDVVTLTATPALGWSFDVWSGDADCEDGVVTITGDTTCTATFARNEYTLTVDTVGSGSVTKDPDQATYHYGDVVTLTATPALGWSFDVWSGDADCADGVVTITGNTTCTATFTQNEYTLTVNTVGSGNVTRNPDQTTYHYGDVVNLTAIPVSGWDFDGWSGDLSGAVNPTQVTMNGNKAVTANFSLTPVTPVTYTLTLATTGDGYGSLMPEIGAHAYVSGTTVLITATAQPDSEFAGWSGDFTGMDNPTSVLMDSDKSITATFRLKSVCELLTAVGIAGPISGQTDTPYTFTGIITPTSATTPLTFTWTPAPLSGQGTLAADYQWATADVYTLMLRADHCGGVLTATHRIDITTPSTCPYGADAYEEDDTPQTARSIAPEETQTRNFFDDAVDWITITVGRSDTYTFTTTVEGQAVDTVLSLFDRDGQTLLMENDNAPGPVGLSSQIVWQAPNDGVYYLRVTNRTGFIGCDTHYKVHVTVHDVKFIYLPLVMRNQK